MGTSRRWSQGSEDRSDHITILFENGFSIVRLRGEVDLVLREALEEVGDQAIEYGAPVRVDVSELTFIDSTGLAFLARLAAAGNAVGWKPLLLGATSRVRESIEAGGLLPVLDLTDLS